MGSNMTAPPKNVDQRIIDYIFLLRKQCVLEEARIGEKTGLNTSEIHALEIIRPGRKKTIGGLSRLMGLSPSRGGRVIEGMIEKELLRRESVPVDRRYGVVILTDKGEKTRGKIEELKKTCESRITAKMSEPDIGRVKQGLDLLVQALDDKTGRKS
jgi:DNA-binding MarR family transcriptional regulator